MPNSARYRWTPERDRRLRDLASRGATAYQASVWLACAVAQVRRRAKLLGVGFATPARRPEGQSGPGPRGALLDPCDERLCARARQLAEPLKAGALLWGELGWSREYVLDLADSSPGWFHADVLGVELTDRGRRELIGGA